ncbi:MAG TPA: ABC transporter permease, partial [Piscinibacter sp.]|nr:ABC transporter permease [Piscinibacter sp.]
MIKLIARRLLGALPNLIGVIVVTFLLTRALPGDPAAYFAGGAATQEAVAQVRAQLGLDKPLVEQFFRYVADLAHGELGTSLTTGQPVLQELITRLPASIEMVLLALTLACAIALPLGVLAATRPGSWIDQLCRLVTTAGVSLPTFFTGLVLSYIFYFLLGWAPSPLGRLDPMFSPPPQISGFYLIDAALAGDASLWWASFKQLILPTLTMAIFVLAPIARMTRASMLSVLGSDFIR